MITWIASYPKSGNTWVRSLLIGYLYSKTGKFNFNLLGKIPHFPHQRFFKEFKAERNNIPNVAASWIKAQQLIIKHNKGDVYLKTHSALASLEGYPFTAEHVSKAVIYIVRDPRALITSFASHFSRTLPEALNFMKDSNQFLMEHPGVATVLGSWADNYNSWKQASDPQSPSIEIPLLIVKYEDLVKNPTSVFKKILKFLKIKINNKKFKAALKSCDFKVMVKNEKKFPEAASNKRGKRIDFFSLGPNHNWKKTLDPKIAKELKKAFKKEMKELGYI